MALNDDGDWIGKFASNWEIYWPVGHEGRAGFHLKTGNFVAELKDPAECPWIYQPRWVNPQKWGYNPFNHCCLFKVIM